MGKECYQIPSSSILLYIIEWGQVYTCNCPLLGIGRELVAVTMHLKVKHKASLHISFNLETKSLLQLHVGDETLKLRVCLFSFSSS